MYNSYYSQNPYYSYQTQQPQIYQPQSPAAYQQSYFNYPAYSPQYAYSTNPYQQQSCTTCYQQPQPATTPAQKAPTPARSRAYKPSTQPPKIVERLSLPASPQPTISFPPPTASYVRAPVTTAPCANGEPCDSKASLPPYVSRVEESIRSSNRPIPANEVDIIEVNGVRGIWLNECESFKSEIPLSEYPINADSNPEVVKLRYSGCVDRVQELTIKYLKPPKPQTPGPIVIKQEPNIPLPAAPPIIIRQIAENPLPPPPALIRERPPAPPEPIGPKTILIPGWANILILKPYLKYNNINLILFILFKAND